MEEKKSKKALVLFSGGLDSRVTSKFMEELGFEVHLGFVKLPFGSGCGSPLEENKKFAEEQNFYFHVIDATKGDLLKEYVDFVKNPTYGRGSAINPCKDCKIFIFKQGDKLAKEMNADVICTGEVLGQRPMSQMMKSLKLDEEQAKMTGRILRPLSAKLLPETIYEKDRIVDRNKLLSIEGRQRTIQMKMAQKYNISYPTPAGGCLLCEKTYEKKLKEFLKIFPNPTFEQIFILRTGRMFSNNGLIFVGKDKRDNEKMEEIAKKQGWNILKNEEIPGPTIVFTDKLDEQLAKELQEAYRSKNQEDRKQFLKYSVLGC